jgi:formylglycine-generating enzyme required for sulfatase activity
VHLVSVKTFQMGKTEVTVKQYQRCVQARKCSLPNAYFAGHAAERGREG